MEEQHGSDATFYPSPAAAIAAPAEKLAYVAAFDRSASRPDAMTVVDVDPQSSSYGSVVGWTDLPSVGDELHHFGWNACSSALCHSGHGGHDGHGALERRYLVVPGIRSSRVHIIDTKPDPANPTLVRTIEADELANKAGYSRPHTVHCGPDGLYLSALGGANGQEGPGGVAMLDHDTFDVVGPFEVDRGPQFLAYDMWWHLNKGVAVTSEWGTPSMIEGGVNLELLLGRQYGHALHFWDLAERKHRQKIDLGDQYQMVLELRPAHDPNASWGFVGVVVDVTDLSASIWLWHEDGDQFAVKKVITIPAESPDGAELPPAVAPFGAVPPLITDINLSVDDKWLYVSCFGTGELKQFDVSDPHNPRETGSVRLGGIARQAAHPADPGTPLRGAPQMVEVSRDGRRVYFTNSLYGAWDDQFYPDGVGAWMAKVDVDPAVGGMTIDPAFFPHGDAFQGLRVHQCRLQGGDASSDSYCNPS